MVSFLFPVEKEKEAEEEDEKRARELAHKEMEEMKRKELERLEEERLWKEEQERLAKEAEDREVERKRLEEVSKTISVVIVYLQEIKLLGILMARHGILPSQRKGRIDCVTREISGNIVLL